MISKPLLGLLAMTIATSASAATIYYDDTNANPTQGIFFSSGHYDSIGDLIHLASTGTANQAVVQFVNQGLAFGTFDAQLDIYAYDSTNLIGAQLGSDFVAASNSITSGGSTNVTFSLGNLAVSQDLVFLVQQLNVSNGLDLGLSLYDPPSVGTSDNGFLVVGGGRGGVGTLDGPSFNVFFQLSAADAPEPSTLVLLAAGVGTLSFLRYRRRA